MFKAKIISWDLFCHEDLKQTVYDYFYIIRLDVIVMQRRHCPIFYGILLKALSDQVVWIRTNQCL